MAYALLFLPAGAMRVISIFPLVSLTLSSIGFDTVAALKLPLRAGGHYLVRSAPLRATVEVELRPAPVLTPEHVRRASPAITAVTLLPLPRNGLRVALSLVSPLWVKSSWSDGVLTLVLDALPAPAAVAAAALYPRRQPGAIPVAPAEGGCREVRELLGRLRAGAVRTAGRALASHAKKGGRCAAQARLGAAEAALRENDPALALEALSPLPRTPARDRLLAFAAFRAGDLSRASAAYTRLGPAAPRALAAEAHLAAGDLQRAQRWLADAPAASPEERASTALRLADARWLAGDPAGAEAALAGAARVHPAAGPRADARRRLWRAEAAPERPWERALLAFDRKDFPRARADARAARRDHPWSHIGRASADLAARAFAQEVRELAARRDWAALTLAYFEEPEAVADLALGDGPCDAVSLALATLGLTVAAEQALRRCLPVHRAALRERHALLRLAEVRRARGEDSPALRTLRYLAARDPLGADGDPRFWQAYGELLTESGQFAEAARALGRAAATVRPGDEPRVRRALATLWSRTGHGYAAAAVLGEAPPPLQAPPPDPEIARHLRQVEEGIRALARRR